MKRFKEIAYLKKQKQENHDEEHFTQEELALWYSTNTC